MSLKNKAIINEYLEKKDAYIKLGNIVSGVLKNKLKQADIDIMAIEHRVKEEQSLEGKLELKGEKYKSLDDITDILGARVICFFSDDVEKVAAIIESLFDIDWANSVNKRNELSPEAFGYLSLHYICKLHADSKYPDDMKNKKFEIQIRSTLQHTWAEISHDLGYKSETEQRLLELAATTDRRSRAAWSKRLGDFYVESARRYYLPSHEPTLRKALCAYNDASIAAPNDGRIAETLCSVALSLKDYLTAENAISQRIEINKGATNAWAWIQLGRIAYEKNDFASAASAFGAAEAGLDHSSR